MRYRQEFFLEVDLKVRPYFSMAEIKGKFIKGPIHIQEDREIVQCDALEFPFKWKPEEGYVLIRIHDQQICVGWVDQNNEMNIEFRGTDPDKITKEIVRRDFLCPSLISFISKEVIRAHYCLINRIEYIQG